VARSENFSNENSQAFLEWFIDFVEGNGSFVVSKNKVYFDLTQNLQDLEVLNMIKRNLGFGSIVQRREPERRVGVFYVTGKTNFLKLVHLFNGNLVCSHRKTQFRKWLETFNQQYNMQIAYLESNKKPSFDTDWLSGFIDAEGSFRARFKPCKTSRSGKSLLTEFTICQKDEGILSQIKKLFSTLPENRHIRFDKRWKGFEFHLSHKKKLLPLISYLNRSKLKSKKQLDFAI
jgi:hypothetical protein